MVAAYRPPHSSPVVTPAHLELHCPSSLKVAFLITSLVPHLQVFPAEVPERAKPRARHVVLQTADDMRVEEYVYPLNKATFPKQPIRPVVGSGPV